MGLELVDADVHRQLGLLGGVRERVKSLAKDQD
jgi:hypothetical protein